MIVALANLDLAGMMLAAAVIPAVWDTLRKRRAR